MISEKTDFTIVAGKVATGVSRLISAVALLNDDATLENVTQVS